MTSATDSGPTDAGLGCIEQAYLDQVLAALADLPNRSRADARATAAENLAERPRAVTFEQLVDDLGLPVAYAQALRADLELVRPGRAARFRSRRRAARIAAVLAVVAVAVGGLIGVRWWSGLQAQISSHAGMVCSSVAGAECDQTGITTLSSPAGDGVVVQCWPGAPLTIGAEIAAEPGVTLTAATIPTVLPEGNAALLRLDEVRPWPRGPNGEWPTAPTGWPIAVGGDEEQVQLRAQFTMICSPEFWSPASGLTLTDMQISYHAWGRDRVTTMKLIEPVQIVMPGG